VLALYAVILMGSPALHHDLACHVKSPAHCDACTASPVASRIETSLELGMARLAAAGAVESQTRMVPLTFTTSQTKGRSPPA